MTITNFPAVSGVDESFTSRPNVTNNPNITGVGDGAVLAPDAIWFDASDTSTMTLTGTRLDLWNDKLGSGKNFATVGALGTSFNPVRTSTLFDNLGGIVFTTGGKYLQSNNGFGLNGTTGWTVLIAESRTNRAGFWHTTDFNRSSMVSTGFAERFGHGGDCTTRYGLPRNIPFIQGIVNTGTNYKYIRNGVALNPDQGSINPSDGALTALQLGGWQGAAGPAAFDLAGIVYWPRILTDAEISSSYSYLKAFYAIADVPDPTWNIVVHGNSHSVGVGGTSVSTMNEGILAANGSPKATDWTNLGVNGATTADLTTSATTLVDPLFDSSIASNKRILIFWEGTNHIATTVSADSAFFYNAIKDYCIARKAANPTWPIIVGTILPRGGTMANSANYEAVRTAVNTSIRNALIAEETWLDAVADVGGDATIGESGDSANATYYNSDAIHLKDAGHTIAATYFRDAINTITGL